MSQAYEGVTTRFLRTDERLVKSKELEMPLVIEATNNTNLEFLHTFLNDNSTKISKDLDYYGAILLRGFDIKSDKNFEDTIRSIHSFKPFRQVFMSEAGREQVNKSSYVLHTNSIYKTGGTVYLGGFHSENYYAPDVPSYICFCCLEPSKRGGETGIINTKKIYPQLSQELQQKLEKSSFLSSIWLINEVTKRYQCTTKDVIEFCKKFNIPLAGVGDDQCMLMYKPNVWVHPNTHTKALQINFFELPTLNKKLRRYFMNDYPGKDWFLHRLVWRFPEFIMHGLEYIYMSIASFLHSPKNALKTLYFKYKTHHTLQKNLIKKHLANKVKKCFNEKDVNELASLMHEYYSSCLWQKGDILLIDNKQVIHAGMPGAGMRCIRALICNPLDMPYADTDSGLYNCHEAKSITPGEYLSIILSS